MTIAKVRLSLLRRTVFSTVAVWAGVWVFVPPASSAAGPAARREPPGAASCGEDCNRKASDCLDVCEEKFKDDDRARVTCKFECANKRQQCEKDCS